MSKAIEINTGGIKCDNPKCDYKNENVSFGEMDKWINKSCPKCGCNLLTQADYDNMKLLISTVDALNGILPDRKEEDKLATMTVKMNGTGKMNIDIKNQEDK